MRYTIFYLVVMILLSSCSAGWHIKRAEWKDPGIFEPKTDTVIEKVYSDTTIVIDTIISVTLPRDTVKIDSLVPITSDMSFDPILKKNGIITTRVEMIKGRLLVESYLDSTLLHRLQYEITIRDALITELTTINNQNTVIIEKKETLLNWIKWIVLSIFVLFIIIFFIRLF